MSERRAEHAACLTRALPHSVSLTCTVCRDNLDEDMAPWAGGGFTFEDFKRMAELHPEGAEVQMLEVPFELPSTAVVMPVADFATVLTSSHTAR